MENNNGKVNDIGEVFNQLCGETVLEEYKDDFKKISYDPKEKKICIKYNYKNFLFISFFVDFAKENDVRFLINLHYVKKKNCDYSFSKKQ